MADFTINEMQEMQKALQEKYKDKWEPICAEVGKNKLLWMIGEVGEVIDLVKKHGGTEACTDEKLRKEHSLKMQQLIDGKGAERIVREWKKLEENCFSHPRQSLAD